MKKKTKNNIQLIISGGQSGVDRSALDFSIAHNIPHAGWCPKNRWAEDGRIPQKYDLKETESDDPAERTLKNVLDSDGTLIIYESQMDKGTQITIECCINNNKPYFKVDLSDESEKPFENWVEVNKIKSLSIAGPREGNSPGIYDKTQKILKKLFLD